MAPLALVLPLGLSTAVELEPMVVVGSALKPEPKTVTAVPTGPLLGYGTLART
jgi:hypothetical protein